MVIPSLLTLEMLLTKMKDGGLGSTKDALLKSLRKRFFSNDKEGLDVLTDAGDALYVLPTILDPRYKHVFPTEVFENAKRLLTNAVMCDEEDHASSGE